MLSKILAERDRVRLLSYRRTAARARPSAPPSRSSERIRSAILILSVDNMSSPLHSQLRAAFIWGGDRPAWARPASAKGCLAALPSRLPQNIGVTQGLYSSAVRGYQHQIDSLLNGLPETSRGFHFAFWLRSTAPGYTRKSSMISIGGRLPSERRRACN